MSPFGHQAFPFIIVVSQQKQLNIFYLTGCQKIELENNFYKLFRDTLKIIINQSSKIGITASASSPEILVTKILKKIELYYDINIIESDFDKEDIHFKIPQKLKEAI